MQLLIETLQPDECALITEAEQSGKDLWIYGVFMQGNIKNRNNRVYPLHELSRIADIAKKNIKESNGIMGELDHPDTLTINLDRVSHIITELSVNGNNIYGKAKILGTPMGQIASKLIEAGIKLGVSSRGTGSVTNEGAVTDFNFVTCDLVATPSAPGAVPNSIYESVMNFKHGERILTLSEAVKHDAKAQQYLKTEINKFISSLFK